MKELILRIKEWWMNLALRERQLLAAGSLFVFVFIFYEGLLMPYYGYIESMRKQINRDQALLVWMQAADKEIQKMESQAKKPTNAITTVTLLGQLQKEIDKKGLGQALNQLKQTSHDAVEMHFQKVSFDKLIELLLMIVKTYPVAITQLSVVSAETGLVNADVVLGL